MKTTLLITAIIISIWTASIAFTNASEALSGRLIVDFEDESAKYTETHDFSAEYGTVKTSVYVEKSDCLKCLDYYYITDCQARGECLDVYVINN